jgi:hypothetical protein
VSVYSQGLHDFQGLEPKHLFMSDSNTNVTPGTDWTRLLTDPDLLEHLGSLLQTYREAPPEKREEALLKAMREIKTQGGGAATAPATSAAAPRGLRTADVSRGSSALLRWS